MPKGWPQSSSERLTGLAEKIMIQTTVTMDPSPKTVELPSNEISRGSTELQGQ